ncbi:hypothetical protein DYH09_26005 [bacterium CPR1]|nr:hypothetical protein [bacterium CPR1]
MDWTRGRRNRNRAGLEQGLQLGQTKLLQEMRQPILTILARRFEGDLEALRLALEPMDDIEQLRELSLQAATTSSLAGFQALLSPG